MTDDLTEQLVIWLRAQQQSAAQISSEYHAQADDEEAAHFEGQAVAYTSVLIWLAQL